jgi:hypothetical protein
MPEISPVGIYLNDMQKLAEQVETGTPLTFDDQKLLINACNSLLHHVWYLQNEIRMLTMEVNNLRTGYDLH